MSPPFEALSVIATAVCAVLGLLLLLIRTPRGRSLERVLRRLLRGVTGRPDLGWLSWWHLALIAAVVYGAVAGFDVVTGAYTCPGPMQESDLIGYLNSGRALLAGGNPFHVADCGTTIPEPYGISAILISAVGSLGGIPGIAVVWGIVGVALVPLTWWVAGPDRRYLTLFVVASPLYLPLIVTQIDGASNALVPVAVLASLCLMAQSEPVAGAVGGFLATGRFPALFPILASFGGARRRYFGAGALIAAFGLVTALTYARWGSEFVDVVFVSQIGRRSFSLNFYGILQQQGLLPSGSIVPAAQALLTLTIVGVAFFRVRPGLRAAALTLAAVSLLTQFLSFNILVSLLPVALVSARARWWLWAIGIVGAMNYDVAYSSWALLGGVYWPTELLDAVLTVFLVGLFIDLWRAGTERETGPALGGRPSGSP